MAELSGTIDNRYEIINQIGHGGMAHVYLVKDIRLDRYAAMKILLKDSFALDDYERLAKRFDIEARTLARLTHPNIVQIYDYGFAEGSPYLITEYIDGGNLKQQIGKPFPYNQAASILAPIADGLAYAHEHGVLHRDVKPANILLRKNGQPLLTDFGIAKILSPDKDYGTLTKVNTSVGTPDYMAPEQCLGYTIDGRADEYSLGMIFFEMCSGIKPYADHSQYLVIQRQISDPVPRIEDYIANVPQELSDVFNTVLAKDPNQRYASMSVFANELRKLSAAENVAPPTPVTETKVKDEVYPRSHHNLSSPQIKTPFWKNIKNIIRILIACIILVVIAIVGLLIFIRQKKELQTEKTDSLPLTAEIIPAPTEIMSTEEKITDAEVMLPTATEILPTATEILPTATEILPTATEILPTATDIFPTATEILPTAAEILPTATEILPTATDIFPTATEILPIVEDVVSKETDISPILPDILPAEVESTSNTGEISFAETDENIQPTGSDVMDAISMFIGKIRSTETTNPIEPDTGEQEENLPEQSVFPTQTDTPSSEIILYRIATTPPEQNVTSEPTAEPVQLPELIFSDTLTLESSLAFPEIPTDTALTEKNSNSVKEIKAGEIIEFGTFAGAPIQWFVLDTLNNGSVLLLSVELLKFDCYNTSASIYANWADSSLRNWLNSEFLDEAFPQGSPERNILEKRKLENGINYNENDIPAQMTPSTEDYIFLLSVPEYRQYRDIIDTYDLKNYKNPEDFNEYGKREYWLRSQGVDNTRGATSLHVLEGSYTVGFYVSTNVKTEISISGVSEISKSRGVRPAIFVDLDGLMELL